jgi:hypothetical protein
MRKCLQSRGIVDLFPLLAAWSQSDLDKLLEEIDEFSLETDAKIQKAWAEQVFSPSNFLSPRRSRQLDEAREAAKIELLGVCAEIASVAIHYKKREVPCQK